MQPELKQHWPVPSRPLPVVCIGAGGIVENAHLPAYRALGIPVQGLFDTDNERARSLSQRFAVKSVFPSLALAAASGAAVFDVAVPARHVPEVIAALPHGAAVLIQKPMGETLEEARHIRAICHERALRAALNFQLRFSPNMLALSDAIQRGDLGDVVDVEVRVNTYTPWHLWPFLQALPRHEILYHSIHYLDLLRALLGEPAGVYAKVVRHPSLPEYADTRSAVILDYGERRRVLLSVFHGHDNGARHAASQLKVEGTEGVAVATMGVNLAYPAGVPDTLELAPRGQPFHSVPLRGSWFPSAFEGPMSNLQRFVLGEDKALVSSVDDAFQTMALVEACYQSSARGGTSIPQ